MIKKLVFTAVVIAIGATVAYQMGWLSWEGEDIYEDTRESVMDKGENIVDKAREVVD